jgi:hypothetical protein
VKKRRQELHEKKDDEDPKKQKIDEKSQEERLKASTIPFWNVTYDKQVNTLFTFTFLPVTRLESAYFLLLCL